MHEVSARPDIEGGLVPVDAIAAGGVGRAADVACHVPHLEDPVRRIIPDPVAEGHCRRTRLLFPGSVGFQHWIGWVILCQVERAMQCRPLDEEVIHKKLPAYIDRNHRRRMLQIRGLGNRLSRLDVLPVHLWRPHFRQHDAVVQDLPRMCRFNPCPQEAHAQSNASDPSEFPTYHSSPLATRCHCLYG
jgi:hypothetical protein